MKDNASLKTKILQGGAYLAIRQLASSMLSLVSVLIIARILGPEKYGVVAIAVGTFYFTFEIAKLGLDVYVIREPHLPADGAEQVLAFYSLIGLFFCILCWISIAVASLFSGFTVILQTFSFLVPVVWIGVIGKLHTAMLERELRFAEVGWVETLAQIVGSVFSMIFVLIGWGYWGPVAAQALQFLTLTIAAINCYPIPWRLRWKWVLLKPALRYGLMYAGSNWVFALKSMTVPLFVAPVASLKIVGLISIAIRFADQLGTFRFIAFRLSISALAKVKGMEAICRTVGRGMVYQGLMVGPLYAAFSCVALLIIPRFFGQEWLPSTQIFPLIAFSFFSYTLFSMHCSALYTFDRVLEVAKFHLLQVGLLWVSSLLLVPSLGLWGYPIAELVSLLSYVSIHRSLVKLCGSPDYMDALCLTLATAVPLMAAPWISTLAGLSLFVLSYGLLFALRPTMRQIPIELYSAWRVRKIAQPK